MLEAYVEGSPVDFDREARQELPLACHPAAERPRESREMGLPPPAGDDAANPDRDKYQEDPNRYQPDLRELAEFHG